LTERRREGYAARHPGRHQDRAHRLRPAASNLLDDGSPLALPADGQLRADQELINGIGVPPGYYLPLTAQGPPAGEDPAIAQALTLLGGRPGAPGADARREGTATAIGRPVPPHPSGRKSQPQSCGRLVGRLSRRVSR